MSARTLLELLIQKKPQKSRLLSPVLKMVNKKGKLSKHFRFHIIWSPYLNSSVTAYFRYYRLYIIGKDDPVMVFRCLCSVSSNPFVELSTKLIRMGELHVLETGTATFEILNRCHQPIPFRTTVVRLINYCYTNLCFAF